MLRSPGNVPDHVAIYQNARTRFVELVRSLPAGMLARQLPACPAWTVHQVVAHIVGANADFVSHNFPTAGMSFEDWTATQVAKREGRLLAELIEEWDEMQPALLAMLADGSIPHVPLINDLATHEQDVRGMAGLPGGRDAPGHAFSRSIFISRLGSRIQEAGIPALTLQSEEGAWTAGEGEPGAAVTASAFELCRALSGRRSLSQIAAFIWEGDAAPYVPLFPSFSAPEHDIVEQS